MFISLMRLQAVTAKQLLWMLGICTCSPVLYCIVCKTTRPPSTTTHRIRLQCMYERLIFLVRLCVVFVSLIKYSGTEYQSYVNIILLQKCVMNESFRGCQIIGNSIQYDFMLLKIQPRNKQRTQRTHTHTRKWGTK